MHTEQDLLTAVALLKEKLEPHRGENITGSKVGEILINQCSFRLKNLESPKLTLSSFISLHLPSTLSPNGLQGGDNLYFVGNRGEPLRVQPEYRYWLAFAKADEPNQFAIRDADKQPAIIVNGETSLGTKVVPKVMLEDLERIKESYIFNYASSGKPELPSATAPYLQWVAEVRELSGQQMNAWNAYRIEQLKKLFEQRLTEMDIDPDNQARLILFLSESQRNKPQKLPAGGSDKCARAPTISKEDSRRERDADEVFRNAVAEVINRLSIAELRELKLPAGLLMDALLGRG